MSYFTYVDTATRLSSMDADPSASCLWILYVMFESIRIFLFFSSCIGSTAYQILHNYEVVSRFQVDIDDFNVVHRQCSDECILWYPEDEVLEAIALQLTCVIVNPRHLT